MYSWAVFSEQLSGLEVLGIVVVIAGVYIVKRQYSAKAEEDTDAVAGGHGGRRGWLRNFVARLRPQVRNGRSRAAAAVEE